MPSLVCNPEHIVKTDLGPCDACAGSGMFQINEPLTRGICIRCHGTGKDRIVSIVYDEFASILIVLTANGNTVEFEMSNHELDVNVKS